MEVYGQHFAIFYNKFFNPFSDVFVPNTNIKDTSLQCRKHKLLLALVFSYKYFSYLRKNHFSKYIAGFVTKKWISYINKIKV